MIYAYEHLDSQLHQSDIIGAQIFLIDNVPRTAVLLTPECDLIVQPGRNSSKTEFLLLAGVQSFDRILNSILSQLRITRRQRNGSEPIDSGTFADLKASLSSFFSGAIFPRYFYLPPLSDFFSHSVIDFQLLQTVVANSDSLHDLMERRIAGVRSSWREAIPVRFSNYTSRIGVEDYSDSYIDSILNYYELNLNIG